MLATGFVPCRISGRVLISGLVKCMPLTTLCQMFLDFFTRCPAKTLRSKKSPKPDVVRYGEVGGRSGGQFSLALCYY